MSPVSEPVVVMRSQSLCFDDKVHHEPIGR